MPRTGITYDDVSDAVHALEKAGVTPSIRLIREKLGRGSLSTVAEHKRAFDTERATGPGPALPDPIAKQLIAGAQSYWEELVDAAEAEIAAAREAAQAQVDGLEENLAAAADEVAGLKDTLGARDTQIDEQQKAAAAQAASYEELSKTAQTQEVEIARLQTELKALQAQRDESVQALRDANQSLAASALERAGLAERLEGQAAAFATEKAALQEHCTEYRDRLVTVSEDHRRADTARGEAEKAAAAAEQKASAIERENGRLNHELDDARAEARLLTEKLGELRGELEAIRQAHAERLADREEQLKVSASALEEAQTLVRQYVERERSLVQELLDERRSQST